MTDREPTPRDKANAQEQVKHSGVHGYELPVREYRDTPLDNAPLDYDPRKEKSLDTSHLPEDLRVSRTDKETKPKRKLTRKQRITIGVAGAALGSIIPIGLAVALNGDGNTEPKQEPNVSGPEVPGNGANGETTGDIFVEPGEAGFDGEVPAGFESPITLTDSEVTTLKSEDYAAIRVIYDEKLVPVVNAAVTALLANGGTAEGLNFSNVINDKNTISQMEELVAPYTQYGTENLVDQTVQLCDTTPNEDGSRNFCGPLQASRVNVNENIIWDIYAANADSTAGSEVSLHTAMQPRIYGGKLILATDGAIRSDF